MSGRRIDQLKIMENVKEHRELLPDFAAEYFSWMSSSDFSANTCRVYINHIENFLKFIESDIKSIVPKDITQTKIFEYIAYIKNKSESTSYQAIVWSAINQFITYLQNRGYIEKNIIMPKRAKVEIKSSTERIHMTKKKFNKILSCVIVDNANNLVRRKRDYAIMVILMNIGLRERALKNIDIEDIDFKEMTINTREKGKGINGKERCCSMSPEVAEAIKEWLDVRSEYTKNKKNTVDENALFISQKGSRMNEKTLFTLVKKYSGDALGKENAISPHKLRGGLITILHDSGADIDDIREYIGHNKVETTSRYIAREKGKNREMADKISKSLNLS